MLTNLERTIRNGMLEAKEEGELKGKLEGKLEVAKAMFHEGMPLEAVARITGLEKETLHNELLR